MSLVHTPFLERDLNRGQVLQVVRKACGRPAAAAGDLLKLIGMPEEDYQRLMGFLRHHRLKPERGAERPLGELE